MHMCFLSVATSCVCLSCGWLYTLGRAIHIRKILYLHGYFCSKCVASNIAFQTISNQLQTTHIAINYIFTHEHHMITHHVYLVAENLVMKMLLIQLTLVILKLSNVSQNVMNTFMTQSNVMMMWM